MEIIASLDSTPQDSTPPNPFHPASKQDSNSLLSMDTTAVKTFFTSSGLSSTGPENQKLFDDAIANLPISFGEGIDIAGYSDRIQR